MKSKFNPLKFLAHNICRFVSKEYRELISYKHITYHSGPPECILHFSINGVEARVIESFNDKPEQRYDANYMIPSYGNIIIESPAKGLIIGPKVMKMWHDEFVWLRNRIETLEYEIKGRAV